MEPQDTNPPAVKERPLKAYQGLLDVASRGLGTRFATEYVHTDGANAVATNGRVLVVIPLPKGLPLVGLWTRKGWKRLCEAESVRATGTGAAEVEDGIVLARGVGEFPNWKAMLAGPESKPEAEVVVNPAYMVTAAKALGVCGARSCAGLHVAMSGTRPLVCKTADEDGRFALVMPMCGLDS